MILEYSDLKWNDSPMLLTGASVDVRGFTSIELSPKSQFKFK